MAKVEVGSQLKWQGKPVVCTSIYTLNETMYAPRSSLQMRSDMHEPVNVKIVAEEWDEFEEGDLITLESQRLQLTEMGKGLYFVYPYLKVHKESLNGSSTVESSNRKAADDQAEANRSGDQGGAGVREPSPGQDGGAEDRHGSSGGGRLIDPAEVGEEGKHAIADNGSGASGGAGCAMSDVRRAVQRALAARRK